MGSASIDLCCLEQADDVVGTSPWHLRSPTKTWRQAVRHTAAQQFEGHVDSIPSKEQVTLLLKREQRGPQPQHYWDCHSLVMTQEHRALLVLSLNSVSCCHQLH